MEGKKVYYSKLYNVVEKCLALVCRFVLALISNILHEISNISGLSRNRYVVQVLYRMFFIENGTCTINADYIIHPLCSLYLLFSPTE